VHTIRKDGEQIVNFVTSVSSWNKFIRQIVIFSFSLFITWYRRGRESILLPVAAILGDGSQLNKFESFFRTTQMRVKTTQLCLKSALWYHILLFACNTINFAWRMVYTYPYSYH